MSENRRPQGGGLTHTVDSMWGSIDYPSDSLASCILYWFLSFRTAFTDLNLDRTKWALVFVCFSFFLYFFVSVHGCVC